MVSWYLRKPGVAVARGSEYVFVAPGQPPLVLEGIDVGTLAALLHRTHHPASTEQLADICEADVLDSLVERGILERGDEAELRARVIPPWRAPGAKRCKTIVVGMSGAVGVIGMLGHVIELADRFAERVEVVISEGAARFIQPRLYEYAGFRVWSDPFEPRGEIAVPHEQLAMAADLVLIAPASASMLHKLAHGACSDFISLLVAATKAPVVVAPSTNPSMWMHPPVQRNVAQLRADGIWVIDPGLTFLIANRDQGGVGGLSFDTESLFRTLDAILALHK
jgi:3-polyprenyl-4-hydroxybenzoate decarboxylase